MNGSPCGLTSAEAAARLQAQGPNALPQAPPESFLRRLLRQLADPLVYLLMFALAVDLTSWGLEGGREVPVEALTIATILLLNAGLGLWQEGRAKQALQRLEALAAPLAWLLRDGRLVRLPAREIVPGDVVRVEAGDRVPADGTVVPPGELLLDESILTGESLPLEKGPGAELAGGTLVTRGQAQLEVLRTGAASALGRLAGLLQTVEPQRPPLERRMHAFGARVVRVVLVVAFLLTAVGIAVEGLHRAGQVFLFAVAMAVAAVPEGLPAVLALTLALGVERMSHRKAVVRSLPAVEALGSVTVIATDKTGTLTENRLRVLRVECAADAKDQALRCLVLCNDADPGQGAGDPLELALYAHARAQGLDPAALRAAHPRQGVAPFDSVRKRMRVTVRAESGSVDWHKGAPEALLPRSTLDDQARARWLERAAAAAGEGAKVLGLARGAGEAEQGLTWLGLVVLGDPPRAEVPAALARARAAGIRVIMLTGDHPQTAREIARQVGIDVEQAVVTGDQLAALPEQELRQLAGRATVFARVAPEHKLRLVQALQAAGEVVAMTGDGVNDAPALKRADVGVVMGQRGSDVAREAGDLILLDDDFATIVAAVEEGRGIYENIQKFVRFLFATNLSELVVVLIGSAGSVWLRLSDPSTGALLLPLTAAQILWINLVTDGIPALSLALDENPGVMTRPPRDPRAPLLDRRGLTWIVGAGLILAALPLLLLLVVPWLGYTRPEARTLAFHLLVVTQLLSVRATRGLQGASPRNRSLAVAVGVAIGLQGLMATVPFLRPLLGLEPLPWEALPVLGVGVLLALAGLEGWAAWVRRWDPPQEPTEPGQPVSRA